MCAHDNHFFIGCQLNFSIDKKHKDSLLFRMYSYGGYMSDEKLKKVVKFNQLKGITEEYTTLGGREHGVYRQYYNDVIIVESNYVNGVKHGQHKEFYISGNKLIVCDFVNGFVHGLYQSFYEDGTPHEIINHAKGAYHGEFIDYYDNGEIYIICNFVEGVAHGEHKSFWSDGGINTIRNYVNGELHGQYCFFEPDGKTIHKIYNFVNGKIQGEYKRFIHGELIEYCFYDKGDEVDVSIHGMDIKNLSDDDINLLRVIYG